MDREHMEEHCAGKREGTVPDDRDEGKSWDVVLDVWR